MERLATALRVLETDRSLLKMITPHEAAGAFGISGKLAETYGGHRRHVQLASILYALLGAICVVMEVAYEYILMGRCLYWHSGQLNEIKRECLIAERLDRVEAGWT